MKNYLLVDTLTDYKALNNEKELKELLVELVGNDTRENINEENIVRNNIKTFEELAKENVSMNYIEKQLEGFSYKIIDLLELQRDLEDAKDYFTKKESFNEIIEVINKGVNESV